MLVLSRKAMQAVIVGEDVRITVIRVEGNQVRIGIEAPGDVRILRGELIDDQTEFSALAGAGGEMVAAHA